MLARPIFTLARATPMVRTNKPKRCFWTAKTEYYLDGVRVNTFWTPPRREMPDIEQVEVLKGPASILYGRLEPGGLINLVTKQPLVDPHFEVQQQFGSFGFYRTTLDATGPVTPDRNLLYRFDMAYENAGSFHDLDHNYRIFLAPRLRWAPTEDTQANFYLEYLNSRDPIQFGIPVFQDANGRPFGIAPVPITRNYGAPGSALYDNLDLRVGFNWSHAFNKDWKLTQRFDAWFRDYRATTVVPLSPSTGNCALFSCPIDRFMNNAPGGIKIQNYYTSLDLTGHVDTFGLGHTLLIGSDYYRNHTYAPQALNFPIAWGGLVPGTDLFFPTYTPNIGFLSALADFASAEQSGQYWYGLYLQDQIALPYNFHLLAGFRYDDASAKDYVLTTIPPPATDTSTSLHEHAVKPRVGLLWQPIPQLSLYGNYVENFGLSNPPVVNQPLLPPTSATQWEAGVKTELDNRFTATFAWFDIVKTNVATPSPDPVLAAQGVQVATGAVRNTGVELDFKGQVTPEVKVIGSYAIIDSKIIADNNGNLGHRLFAVPHKSGSLWAVYEPEAEPFKGFAFGAGLYGQSNVEFDNANSFTLPGYITVNLMARYKFTYEKTRLTFQLNVNNLLDKGYFLTAGSGPGIQRGTPRTFLGSLKMEF
jgi:iron complex outermembrane receptor protein